MALPGEQPVPPRPEPFEGPGGRSAPGGGGHEAAGAAAPHVGISPETPETWGETWGQKLAAIPDTLASLPATIAGLPDSFKPASYPHPARLMAREKVRRHRRDTLHATLWTVIFAGPFLGATQGGAVPVLAAVANLSDRWYGLLQSLPALALLAQLPGVLFVDRLAHRPRAVAALSLWGRLIWIVLGAVPLVLDPGPAATATFLVGASIAWVCWMLGAIAWQSLMGDLVPSRRRGKYFGMRSRLFAASNLLSSLALAATLPSADQPHAKWVVFAVFTVASLSGAAELIWYRNAYDPPRRRPRTTLADLVTPLKDRAFLAFLLFGFLIAASNGIVGPFLWRHFLSAEQLAPLKATLILQTSALVGTVMTAPLWGKWVDAQGSKAAIVAALALSQVPTMLWPVVTPDRWLLGMAVMFVGVTFWVGVDVAMQNRLFASASRGGTGYYAVYNAVVAAAGFGATAIGGELAERLAGAQWLTEVSRFCERAGLVFNVYMVLVGLCVVLRSAALLAAVWLLPRESPVPTAVGVRAIGLGIRNHMAAMALFPVRFPGRHR